MNWPLPKPTGISRWSMAFYGLILAGIGPALAIPGIHLIALGGSPYYVIAGVATVIAGLLLLFGRWSGALLYAAAVVGTILWAFWEVGLDGWALVPRVVAPLVLGVPLLIGTLFAALPRWKPAIVGGALAAAVLVSLGVYSARESIEAPTEKVAAIVGERDVDWVSYGNNQGGSRFSPLAQITTQNVARLQIAWTAPIDQPARGLLAARFENTPLKIGQSLYVCTSLNDIVALDPRTGKQRWRFYAHVDGTHLPVGNCRGLAYYRVSNAAGACAARLYTATIDARLLAVDADTGKPCKGFGDKGAVSLLDGLGTVERGYYLTTSPPQEVRGKIVVNAMVADGQLTGEPSGVIRAFDGVTGKLAWAWDMGQPDRHGPPPPGETYTPGTPNSWAPMSADDALGLIYVPTGNATPDYFGAYRTPAMEKFSTSLVALDADTGIPRWHFQLVHHDVWDYDVSVQPQLIDLTIGGAVVPVVVQGSKEGELFVLDRRTGKPIYPVVERPAPQGAAPGDWLSPTQPHSTGPNFIGERLTEKDMWGSTPLDQLWCRLHFREARYKGPFTPMGLTPAIIQPGFAGGTEWGSTSFDPGRGLLLLVSNYIENYNVLLPRGQMNAGGVFPSKNPSTINWGLVPQGGTPYGASTVPFQAPTGTPCTKPPYSRINAVDLRTGKVVWSRSLGTARALGPYGMESGLPIRIGTPSFGGSITTAGGVTFVAGSLDQSIRAFETRTGRMLWRGELPADGLTTPMTYSTPDGRQFVVIAVGGKIGMGASEGRGASNAGGTIMAFALPRR